ncbi:MAG: helicase-related protein [Chloroflexota bacterium]
MSANAFITNSDSRTLKKRLEELILHSQELKFLVGFFYFSGWQELYESLRARGDLTIKLLVGLDVDSKLGQIFEIEKDGQELSNDELADRFFESLHIALNDEALDTEVFYEQVSYFLELLQSGRLQIKKTLDPNHAKLYFFKMKDEVTALSPLGRFITGSSNLTRAGVQGQNEFNVEISDYGGKEAEEYFDRLWETAIPITKVPERKEFLVRLVQDKTQAAIVAPFEAYALVLKTYLDLAEQKAIKPHVKRLLEEQGYKDYQYQTDAVNQALTIIEEYNGVIIADVVGLGKSIIAGMLAHQLGRRGMVICPPGLMGDSRVKDSGWNKYVEDFKLHGWEVHSSGLLEKAADYLKEHGEDIEVVIVDEAHRFRNEDTADYELLSGICRNRKVILLTATPFNNAPRDIFSLLKLFIIPGKSKITLDENLEARFATYDSEFRRLSYILRYHNHKSKEKRERAEKYYDEIIEAPLPIDLERVRRRTTQLSREIRAALEPVLIRRNRLDLRRDPIYSKEIAALSEVQDPTELFYELAPLQMEFYTQVIEEYFSEGGRFKGAIYQPFAYESARAVASDKLGEEESFIYEQQRNLYEFMRRLLVKRFESSFGAFARSIANFIRVHERVLEFIKNSGGRYILDRSLIEKIYNSDPDDIDIALEDFIQQLAQMPKVPKHQRVYFVEKFERAHEFMEDIESDLRLMRELQEKVTQLNLVAEDPKAHRLVEEIHKILNAKPKTGEPKNKVVIFTEYADTVAHLAPILESEFNGRVITSSVGMSPNFLRQILANFDASRRPDQQEHDFDILLTSDKLSEGVNLNRAGVIINYDIPWNPTRVIQRVGRINRIGKKVFEALYIYNFFPTEKGAGIVKSREVAAQKMFLIHNALGEDAKIFSADETPSPAELYKRVNANPEEDEGESVLTHVRRLFFEIRAKHPKIAERIKDLPPRVKTAKIRAENQLLVFRRKGLGMFIQSVADTTTEKLDVQPLTMKDSLPFIECSDDQPRTNLSPNFWRSYEAIKTHRDVVALPKSERSLETKALNNLKTALYAMKDEYGPYLPFLRALVEDLQDYKTISKSTLRRFASIPPSAPEFIRELQQVRVQLGDDYLDIIKQRLGRMKSEVIIAIENQHKGGTG